MDTRAYLTRIGFEEREGEPRAETLSRLQRAHFLTVPYENMDILRGVPISLEEDKLFDKIVSRRRGGFCFELNELFGRLLRALGFEVTDYFARYLEGERETPMRRHHVLRVKIPGEGWDRIADVGVGSVSPDYPLLLAEGLVQRQGIYPWRFVKREGLGWVLQREKAEGWTDIYSFTEEAQLPVDYLSACFYCEKSPDSIFNREPMIALRTERGRITLDGDLFKEFDGEKAALSRVTDLNGTLKERFGIALS